MLNLDTISENFYTFLLSSGVSQSTLKNYKSDIKHFSEWLVRSVKSLGVYAENLTESIPFINSKTAENYKVELLNSGVPSKTINRKLSTLRRLSSYFIQNEILNFEFTNSVTNIQNQTVKANPSKNELIIKDFENYLIREKVSKNTIKNYLSDINQFFSWINNQN